MKNFTLCVLFSILTLPVFAQRYIPKGFTERLQQDYFLQDEVGEKHFADGSGNALETALLQKVFTEGSTPELQKRFAALQNIAGSDPRWKTLYFDACGERRRVRLLFIRKTYPKIVFAKHNVLGGSHYAYTEAPSDAQQPERRDMICGKLLLLKINADGTATETLLYEAPNGGTLRDPDVSYDGKKMVFSMRNHPTNDDYHLYEMDSPLTAVRGSDNVKQLTTGPGFADIEPCYLPDGNILFNSTRCMQIVDCWWTDVCNLYVIDGKGRFMRRYGFDQVQTNYPQTLADGRVIFTRWDYNDRGQIYPQGLFVMNYDGTAKTEYYGNNSWFPTTILHARPIPNSGKLVAVASGHHTHQRGKLILIDRSKGTQENQGVQLIAPIQKTEAVHVDRYGQDGDQFQYPLAIDEENFIVAYCPEGYPHANYDIPFGLYYVDIHNKKRELLAFDSAVSCGQPVAVKPRPLPTLRASQVDYTKNTGTFYVQDVYEGPGLKDVPKGTIKELRVVALEFRAAGIGSNYNSGPAGSAMISTPIACNNGSWDVKRVLGTVPVEKDGSVYFEVPARTPVYFQLLNERGEAVQTMRSWSVLQPGEMFACVGCHEPKEATLNNLNSRSGTAQTLGHREAHRLLINGTAEGFSFPQRIQPILDTHCISCHTGEKLPDGKPAPFSLLGHERDKPDGSLRHFTAAYLHLTRNGAPNEFVNWLNPQHSPAMLPPFTAGAVKSKLPRMFDDLKCSQEHRKVKLSESEKRQIALWIDLLVPFSGSYIERAAWTPAQRAEYAYYQNKRDRMEAIEAENIAKYIQHLRKPQRDFPFESFTQFKEGGIEYKRKFIEEWLQKNAGK